MRLTLNDEILFKQHNNKHLIIHGNEATYRKVNDTGAFILKLVREKPDKEFKEILQDMSAYYNIPENMMEKDINKFIDDLLENGYLIKNNKLIETNRNNVNYECSSNGIWIKLTNKCNLTCKYCYADSAEGNEEEITVEEIQTLLESLKEKQYNRIVLTGGEPLVRKDLLEIVKMCATYGKVQLLTNGTLGNKTLYEQLLEHLTMIQISMDSTQEFYHEANRGEDTFHKIKKTINYIKEIAPNKIAIAMTPTPNYMGNIKEMIQFCLDNQITSLHVNRFITEGRAKEGYKDVFDIKQYFELVDIGYNYIYECYYKNFKENKPFDFELDVSGDVRENIYTTGRKESCGLNENQISIDCNGDVYLCAALHKEEFKLGSIRENKIEDILQSSIKRFGSFSVDNLDKCSTCDIKYFCGGGCRAIALNEFNNIYGPERNCKNYQNRIYDLMSK